MRKDDITPFSTCRVPGFCTSIIYMKVAKLRFGLRNMRLGGVLYRQCSEALARTPYLQGHVISLSYIITRTLHMKRSRFTTAYCSAPNQALRPR